MNRYDVLSHAENSLLTSEKVIQQVQEHLRKVSTVIEGVTQRVIKSDKLNHDSYSLIEIARASMNRAAPTGLTLDSSGGRTNGNAPCDCLLGNVYGAERRRNSST